MAGTSTPIWGPVLMELLWSDCVGVLDGEVLDGATEEVAFDAAMMS